MKLYTWFLYFILLTGSCITATVVAEPEKTPPEQTKEIPSFDALQANWVFSGIVTNESGERYHYFFQMQRNNSRFHATAMLLGGQNKQVLLFEESNAVIENPEPGNWHVGHNFLQFNPINDSWIFGVKRNNKTGFNFKADMLSSTKDSVATQDLRSGVELLVSQTGRLNGHLQVGEDNKEQFVTGEKAWFRQIWVSQFQENLHPFTGILCQFNDASGFYAVNLQEEDALKGAIAGWRDAQGEPVSMSQFVTVQEGKEGIWNIHIPSPEIKLILQDALVKGGENYQLVAGLTGELKPGFCIINKDKIG
ncbi:MULTISPECIES: hypothetical protein [unclassified Legionella]|uniref:hypothetical protein n=1 Tax=unclassified Legionella TaxID=2622702 RepID=UPI0010556349|nr:MULTISPECIES: hypothetical protein [unclassified Legionella]MDI9819382.1 hypothetical protein [Legionella sp. PL877]